MPLLFLVALIFVIFSSQVTGYLYGAKRVIDFRTFQFKEERDSLGSSVLSVEKFASSNNGITIGESSEATCKTVTLNIFHFKELFRLIAQQFFPECDSTIDKIALVWNIIRLFIPKLLIPSVMGHTLIGIAKEGSGLSNPYPSHNNDLELLGFVDLSLQRNSGDLDVLEDKPLFVRQRNLQASDRLAPYLCNLLVSQAHRKKGFVLSPLVLQSR